MNLHQAPRRLLQYLLPCASHSPYPGSYRHKTIGLCLEELFYLLRLMEFRLKRLRTTRAEAPHQVCMLLLTAFTVCCHIALEVVETRFIGPPFKIVAANWSTRLAASDITSCDFCGQQASYLGDIAGNSCFEDSEICPKEGVKVEGMERHLHKTPGNQAG